MPKEKYEMNAGRRDTSFRSCLVTLFIFLLLMVIVLLCAWPWGDRREHQAGSTEDEAETIGTGAKPRNDELKFDRIVVQPPAPVTSEEPSSVITSTVRSTAKYSPQHSKVETWTLPHETGDSASTRSYTGVKSDRKGKQSVTTLLPPHFITSENLSEVTTDINKVTMPLLTEYSTVRANDESSVAPFASEFYNATQSVSISTEPKAVSDVPTTKSEADQYLITSQGTSTQLFNANVDEPLIMESTTREEVTSSTMQDWVDSSTPPVSIGEYMTDKATYTEHLRVGDFVTGQSPPTREEVMTDQNGETTTAAWELVLPRVTSKTHSQDNRSGNAKLELFGDEADTSSSTMLFATGTTPQPSIDAVCYSGDCKTLASRMLSLMNHMVDPCQNFYEFACGGFDSVPRLQIEDPWTRIAVGLRSIDGNSSRSHHKFLQYYQSCLQDNPVTNPDMQYKRARAMWDRVKESPGPLSLLLVQLLQLDSMPILDASLDTNGPEFVLVLRPPVQQSVFHVDDTTRCEKAQQQFGSRVHDINAEYKDYVACKNNETQLVEQVRQALVALGVWAEGDPGLVEALEAVRTCVFDGLVRLPSAGDLRRTLVDKKFTAMSVSELQQRYSPIDWVLFFETLLKRPVPADTQVQVYFPEYFDDLAELLSLEEYRLVQSALLSILARDLHAIPSRDACDREQHCLSLAGRLLPDIASSLFLAGFPPARLVAVQAELLQLFSGLVETLSHHISEALWLDDSAKSEILQKLSATALADGPALFLNDSFLDSRLNEYEMDPADFLGNSVALLQRLRRLQFSAYGSDPRLPENIWSQFALPYSTEASAIYGLNLVVIPYGLLSKPFLDWSHPKYMTMARLGNVIARAISHHFDTTGIHYGVDGRKFSKGLFSGQTLDSYGSMEQCASFQFGFERSLKTHDGRFVRFMLQPELTYNGRFADESALKLGLESYRLQMNHSDLVLPWLNMTQDQLYYLTSAQVFCSKGSILDHKISLFESELLPPFLRVDTILTNSEDFSEAFACPDNSRMNPRSKCDPFPFVSTDTDYHGT